MTQTPTPDPSSTSTGTGLGEEDLAALQDVLAAEHAAVYLYALLGARAASSPALSDVVRAAYVAHRDRRDLLTATVAAAGAAPVAAAAAYQLPAGPGVGLGTAAGVTAAAAALESACTTTYAAAVGRAAGPLRTQAVGWLTDAALRELALGRPPQVFPGADELTG